MKGDRLGVIEEIVANESVSTQEELQMKLQERGFKVTQATVSRDIKVLGLNKIVDSDGQYKYVLSKTKQTETVSTKFISIFKQTVLHVTLCENLVILKCHTGTGNAAAMALDSLNLPQIAGTIAGDDTVFIAVRTVDGPKVKAYLEELLAQ